MFFETLFLIIISVLFAKAEIQIEGKFGWGEKLPCWRIQNKWTNFVLGGRPLTGYHFYMWSFIVVFSHIAVFFAPQWTWAEEIKLIGFVLLFTLLEDFLWFVLHPNPDYGIKNFKKSNPKIWWHKRWFLGLPAFYWSRSITGVTLFCLGHYFCLNI